MNRAEREARNTPIPAPLSVTAHYRGYKCRPVGMLRQKRRRWNELDICVRCGHPRNPSAKARANA